MKKLNSNQSFFILVSILVLAVITISFQSYSAGTWIRPTGLTSYYNNYLIFKTSSLHLFLGEDLYAYHHGDHFDLFKYSPAFALFMTPFRLFPNWLGLIIWNFVNLFALVFALKQLPNLSKKQVSLILLIGVFELIGSIMNEQSNALMTGLMVLSIAKFEKGNTLWGAFFLVFSVYIKLFSIVLFMMLLFYPKKLKIALHTLMWIFLFTFLPVVFTGWDGLIDTYRSWLNMLQNDYDNSVGFSVVGVMVRWFNYQGSRTLIFAIGVILMMLPLLKTRLYSIQNFRYKVLSAILIWIIIFNHKAESPTFIIAITGIGIYFMTQKLTLGNKILLAFVIVFVSLVYSDLMPKSPRDNFFHAYFIKAVPCIIVWLKIIYELLLNKNIQPLKSEENPSAIV